MNKAEAVFCVRKDKKLGLLIESIKEKGSDNLYFFKHHQQPIYTHCEQVQNVIIKENVQRTKEIVINIAEFIGEYYNCKTNQFEFRGTKLNSTYKQVEKVRTLKINKDIGKMKRKMTIEDNKNLKKAKKKLQLDKRLVEDEAKFQKEYIRRVNELVKERKEELEKRKRDAENEKDDDEMN